VLDAWEEAPVYSERARAALTLTDAVTRITGGQVPDSVFERAKAHFNEQETDCAGFTLNTINAWNRLAITMCFEVGKYQPKARPVSQTAKNRNMLVKTSHGSFPDCPQSWNHLARGTSERDVLL
jgi:hypothetical protein